MIQHWLQELSNPWFQLRHDGNFVLDQDREAVEEFNSKPTRRPEHRVHLEYLPEPYQGNGDAPVVLLSANPCLDTNEPPPTAGSPIDKLVRANLRQEPQDFPFYHLDPQLEREGAGHGGHIYWKPRFRQLIAHVDTDEKVAMRAVAHGILCVEYFPYHTKNTPRSFPKVRSQTHNHELVRRIVQTGSAIILVIRFWGQWINAIPELRDYPRLCRLNSSRRSYLTQRNLPDGRFNDIVEALRRLRLNQ